MSNLQGFGPLEFAASPRQAKPAPEQNGHKFNPAQFSKLLKNVGGKGAAAEGAVGASAAVGTEAAAGGLAELAPLLLL